MQEMQSLQKYSNFEEYVENNTNDIVFGGNINDFITKELDKELPASSTGWNPFSSTTPNPLEVRLDSEADHHSG